MEAAGPAFRLYFSDVSPETVGAVPAAFILIVLLSAAVVLLFTLLAPVLRAADPGGPGGVLEGAFRQAFDGMPMPCFILDGSLNVLYADAEMLRLFAGGPGGRIEGIGGFSPERQPDGHDSRDRLAHEARRAMKAGRSAFEWTCRTPDGTVIPSEVIAVRVSGGGRSLLACYVYDLREINETTSMMRQLEEQAFTDELTGARNRRYFMENAEKELAACVEAGRDFAVIMFDIDRFKTVNDTHGHDIGDEVLKLTVARTFHGLRRQTLVARYGGEEFAVMLPDIKAANAEKVAWQINRRICGSPFMVGNLKLAVSVSLGVAWKTPEFATLQAIIKNADLALYRAKDTGRNRVVSQDAVLQPAPAAPAASKIA